MNLYYSIEQKSFFFVSPFYPQYAGWKGVFSGGRMQEYNSEGISELAKALINVQRTTPAGNQGCQQSLYQRAEYATLNSVMDSCRDALLSNGIWLCQYPVPAEPGYLGLVTKLTHAESGQWQSSLAVVPLPKADPQGVGISV